MPPKKVAKKAVKKASRPAPPPPPTGDGDAAPVKKSSKKSAKKGSKKPSAKKAPPKKPSAASEGGESPAKKPSKKGAKKGAKKPSAKKAPSAKKSSSKKGSAPKKSSKKKVLKKKAESDVGGESAAAEASAADMSSPQQFAAPGQAGGPSPLVPPPPHRHPYHPYFQPYELNPREEEHRRALVEFYMKHNPAKVSQVNEILRYWLGREDELMMKLKERYEVPAAQEARHLSVAAPGLAPGGALFAGPSPGRARPEKEPAVARMALDARMAEIAEQQEKRIREEQERTHADVKNRLTNALESLQEKRRADALAREQRRVDKQKEEEMREAAIKQGMTKAADERRQMETLLQERANQQQLLEEDIARRERELRESTQARAENILSLVDPYSPSREVVAHQSLVQAGSGPSYGGGDGGGGLTGAASMMTSLRSENEQLKDELTRLHAGAVHAASPVGPTTTSRRFPSPPRSVTTRSPGAFTPDIRTPGARGRHHDPQPVPPATLPVPTKKDAYSAAFAPVAECLQAAGLGKYVPIFQAHDFDMEAFRKVTENDLRELGVTGVGARKRIENEAQKQRLDGSVERAASPYAAVYRTVSAEAHPLPVDSAPVDPSPYWIPENGAGAPRRTASSLKGRTPPLKDLTAPEEPSPIPETQRVTHIHHHTEGATYADQQVTQSRLQQMEDKIDILAGMLSAAQSPVRSPARTESPAMDDWEEEWEEEEEEEPVSPRHSYSPVIISDAGLEWHRDLLTRFYQTFDPVKLPQVGKILAEYHERLEELYGTLTAIYSLEQNPYAAKLRATCVRYAPGKAAAAGVLCRMCRGREAELIEHIMTDGSCTTHGAAIEKTGRWQETHDDASGRVFYFSRLAQEAQWSKPAALIQRDSAVHEAIRSTISVSQQLAAQAIPFSSMDTAAQRPPNPDPQESKYYSSRQETAKQGRTMQYKAWLLAFFNSVDPPRVVEADDLLAQWEGQEDALVAALRNKYNA
eukprot:TRINITY_DN2892_c0_g2_i1.p1 TRINITY_DN2892_c0_g2~~TRINITY_DN2892_c0_g2_i1.p1  ORF type:complete len:982 (+),score=290.98 TRINITY_DN2892_c0_g2_i1:134-3079(+)